MRQLGFALIVALATGCTPYQQMGWMGGVDDMQVGDVTYRILAKGNGYTSSSRVEEFVLLRASEIAISRGYEGFIINSAADHSRLTQFTTPGQATTTTMISGGMATSTTVYSPPMTETVFKPGVAVFITLVQDGGLNANMIYAKLAPKYVSERDRLDRPVPALQPTDATESK